MNRSHYEYVAPLPGHREGGWLALSVTPSLVHVYPEGDLITHDIGPEGCICGTKVDYVKRENGSTGRVVTHSSLDGRELLE